METFIADFFTVDGPQFLAALSGGMLALALYLAWGIWQGGHDDDEDGE